MSRLVLVDEQERDAVDDLVFVALLAGAVAQRAQVARANDFH
jgi:hypothetical protein